MAVTLHAISTHPYKTPCNLLRDIKGKLMVAETVQFYFAAYFDPVVCYTDYANNNRIGCILAVDPFIGRRPFLFIAMSAQSEADKAVSISNTYSLSDHALKGSPAKPKE
jgi:hypothetical protein